MPGRVQRAKTHFLKNLDLKTILDPAPPEPFVGTKCDPPKPRHCTIMFGCGSPRLLKEKLGIWRKAAVPGGSKSNIKQFTPRSQ